MSEYIQEYKFKKAPKEIRYGNEEPLNLTDSFIFYHNKNNIRKKLNSLQYLIKSYLNTSLIASGIRDTYLRENLTENHLIIIFSTGNIVKEINTIVEQHIDKCKAQCVYIKNTSKFMLILAKDIEGIDLGVEFMEQILEQTLKDYFEQKMFNDFIKIRPFELSTCK